MEIFIIFLIVFVVIVIFAKNGSDNNHNTSNYNQPIYTKPQVSNSFDSDDEYTSPYLYENIKVVGGFYRSYDAK